MYSEILKNHRMTDVNAPCLHEGHSRPKRKIYAISFKNRKFIECIKRFLVDKMKSRASN